MAMSPSRSGSVVVLAFALALPVAAQSTRPERSGYRETSSFDDVLAFLDSLQSLTPDIRTGTLATSTEGRRIPYVIAARPMVSSPAEAHRAGRPIIYLQANIHGGEVEGKEAAQMVLREVTRGSARGILDRLVLLVAPIYNVDGNERWGPGEKNRPGQNGPTRVGRNTNGQGLNLNRDYIKMEAPETRGSASLLASWDPDVFIDLHTTNGSYHGYALTYAPPLNPNSNPVVDFIRDRFLPQVRQRMEHRHRQRTFVYGNFRSQHPDSLAEGWETYDARPRFGTNWAGLRGRAAILSEGYSNADFRTRIMATYNFVREVLALAGEQGPLLRRLVVASDGHRTDSIAVQSTLAPPIPHSVVAEVTRDLGFGAGGFSRRQRTGEFRAVRMPVYDRFTAARKESRPAGYLIPASLNQVVELLRRQGVGVERITHAWRGPVRVFTVDSVAMDSVFEGHRPVRLAGHWSGQVTDSALAPAWYLVRTDQALGTFAAYLLEPASEDGLVTWNLLDREVQAGAGYPILRLEQAFSSPTIGVP
jgi:Zinc carboxypeptidase